MLVQWHESRYEINYSHFFRGSWHGVLKWCNMQSHKRIISASTIDFRPTLMHESSSSSVWPVFVLCVVIILLQKGKHCGVFRGEGCYDIFVPTRLSVPTLSVPTRLSNQIWYCGAPPWAGMSCTKMGFYLQGQGHSVGFYNQNITVSTISFISSKPVSLLQPNSIWW